MNFLNYITQSRKGKEAQRIEREAMKDPFLADAIEGYDLVKDEDHLKRVETIRETIRRKTPVRSMLIQIAGVAASLLVCIGIGRYLLIEVISPPSPQVSDYRQETYSMQEEGLSQLRDSMSGHSLTVPEPTPLNNNAIKGEPKPATGQEAYKEYLYENLSLPAFDECSYTKGQVVVAFKVNAKGRPYDLDIKKSLCPAADQEAIRVVRQGPNWTLGDKIATVTIRF
ncbi:MAG: energy transducer TonB [Tannerellaceae bacterium]|jgi:hypothetical protein|nr:energy transducer TonB [Tannerellaceae bacterium]